MPRVFAAFTGFWPTVTRHAAPGRAFPRTSAAAASRTPARHGGGAGPGAVSFRIVRTLPWPWPWQCGMACRRVRAKKAYLHRNCHYTDTPLLHGHVAVRSPRRLENSLHKRGDARAGYVPPP